MSNKNNKIIDVDHETEEPVTVEEVVSAPTEPPISGIVSNCNKLNVRSAPTKEAKVICIIDAKTKIIIDPDTSTDDWFHVYLTEGDGTEGFCMKEFITVV